MCRLDMEPLPLIFDVLLFGIIPRLMQHQRYIYDYPAKVHLTRHRCIYLENAPVLVYPRLEKRGGRSGSGSGSFRRH